MLNIVLLFHAHQYERLLQLNLFDLENLSSPFDDAMNRRLIEKMTAEYYIPAGEFLLELTRKYGRVFKFALLLSGSLLGLMKRYSPRAIALFRRIIDSGCAELAVAPLYSELSVLYDREEYLVQIDRHRTLLVEEFGVIPTVFFHGGPLGVMAVNELLGDRQNIRVILIGTCTEVHLIPRAYCNDDGRLFLQVCGFNGRTDLFSRRGVYGKDFKSIHGGTGHFYVCTAEQFERMDRHFFSTFRNFVDRIIQWGEACFSLPSDIAGEEIGRPVEYSPQDIKRGINLALRSARGSEEVLSEGKDARTKTPYGELERNAASALFSLIGEARRKGEEAVLEGLRRLSADDHFLAMRAGNEITYISFLWALTHYELAMTT